jgi:hypothetical protein
VQVKCNFYKGHVIIALRISTFQLQDNVLIADLVVAIVVKVVVYNVWLIFKIRMEFANNVKWEHISIT